ncbi:hypothetical protein SH528x_003175 [Novipirellula sp. SH528]|uniref:hypothetical protein n=1 Tax=Novipirellula sp. SH528 TaxID=3454466 RepID=UPI003FA0C8FC
MSADGHRLPHDATVSICVNLWFHLTARQLDLVLLTPADPDPSICPRVKRIIANERRMMKLPRVEIPGDKRRNLAAVATTAIAANVRWKTRTE